MNLAWDEIWFTVKSKKKIFEGKKPSIFERKLNLERKRKEERRKNSTYLLQWRHFHLYAWIVYAELSLCSGKSIRKKERRENHVACTQKKFNFFFHFDSFFLPLTVFPEFSTWKFTKIDHFCIFLQIQVQIFHNFSNQMNEGREN